MAEPTYWVNTVSLEHVEAGVAGGFTQAGHGRDTQLRRLRPGDGIVFYSPRTAMRGGAPLQRFTARGVITGAEPYRASMSPDFHPWRLEVAFAPVQHADVRPLIGGLSFITDHSRWGLPFRRGLFAVPAVDFHIIADATRPSAQP